MKTIGIVGKGFPESVKDLNKLNYNVILFQDIELKGSGDESLYTRVIDVDFHTEESIYKSLEHVEINCEGLIAIYENYVEPKAVIGKKLGIKTTSFSAAQNVSDKDLMRKAFMEKIPEYTPQALLVNNLEELEGFADKYGFPLMLKPANLVKSLMIHKCSDTEELKTNYTSMITSIDDTYRKYNVYSKPKIIVEEFLEGSMHTVAGFSDKNGEIFIANDIVDNITARDIGVNDSYLFARRIPSILDEEKQEDIKKAAIAGMKALGLNHSPGHVELFYTKNGPKIIEIGGRIGGYRQRMYHLSSGINLIKVEAMLACGEKIDIEDLSSKTENPNLSIVMEILPTEEGKYVGITNEPALKSLQTLHYYSNSVQPGEMVGPASKGYKKVAVVLLLSDDSELIEKEYEYIKNNIQIQTEQ